MPESNLQKLSVEERQILGELPKDIDYSYGHHYQHQGLEVPWCYVEERYEE